MYWPDLITCPWCLDETADDDVNTDDLCRRHLAEYEGLSLDEMDRRDREQWQEWADANPVSGDPWLDTSIAYEPPF